MTGSIQVAVTYRPFDFAESLLTRAFGPSRCEPCRQVFPHLSQIARTYADNGLVVVSVSLEPISPQLQAFLQQQGSNVAYTVRWRPVSECSACAQNRTNICKLLLGSPGRA